MKKKLLFITALLCILSQSTWAQGVKTEDELVNAVKENGAIVQLAADITLNNTITLQENIKVTIKMNSHTLSHKKQLDSNYNCVFIIPASSELVLESGTIDNVNNVNTRNTEYVAGAIVNNGTLTLNTVTVSNCSGLQGGAIKNNQGATLNLNSCTFDTNEAATNDNNGGDGGAVWNSGKLVLYNTSFKDCSAVNGAAIYNEASGTISMGDNNSTTSFYSNKASGDGGAIYNLGTMNMNSTTFSTNIASDQAGAVWNIGILTFKGCDFLYNKANTAAGLYVAPNGKGNVTINGGSFKQNVANIDGGGIYCEYTMNLDAVTFEDNKAKGGNGGAFYISAIGNVTITDENSVGNNINNNSASANGGGIYTLGKLSFTRLTAKNNSADLGGFLYIDANGNVVINTNSTITENTATTLGGGIYDAGTLNMQGKISVKKNTAADSQTSNVYLTSGKVITVTGALDASGIGICLEDINGTFTSGYGTNNSATSPDKVFSADYLEEFYCVKLDKNEAKIDLQSPIFITDESVLRRAIGMFDNVSLQLSNDINITESTLVIPGDKTITLNLGGFKLDRGLTSREWNTGGQVITVREGATLNLSNGTLTGGWGGNSGGLVNEGGTVNLTDVNITGCTGDDRGGAICNFGTLTMKGGSITGNTSKDKEKPTGGGGIFNAEGATATLSGVTITGNEAKNYGGGGVNNWGTVTLDGCTIQNNTSKEYGAGVWSSKGSTLNMQGKNTITGNTGKSVADNVYLTEGTVINVTGALTDSKIGVTLEDDLGVFTTGFKKNHPDGNVDPTTIFAPDEDNIFDVKLDGDEVAMVVQPLIVVDNDPDLRRATQFNGANIQFAADINLSNSTLVIGKDYTMTIDLNGKTLNRGLTSRDFDHGGQVITVRNGATLNLSNGTLTGGYGGNGGGLVNEGGTATLTNVNITGCKADQRGAGISNYGTLTMTGGSVTGNTSNDIKASDSDLTGGGGVYISSGATTTLTGVTITGNQAKGAGGGGVNNWGTVTIDGCTITGNTSKANGGGVWNGPDSKLNMQGKNTVTDNQANGAVNNVYLRDNTVITVTGSLEGSQIGVRMASPGIFTSGYGEHNSGVIPVNYFICDDDDYQVILKDNEAEMKKKMEIDTAIEEIDNGQLTNDGSWYDLSGRKLTAKPSRKGMYISNGKVYINR